MVHLFEDNSCNRSNRTSLVCGGGVAFVVCELKKGVSAFDVAYSLKQATKFVCKTVLPNGMVGVGFDEVAILEYIASDVVDDGSN